MAYKKIIMVLAVTVAMAGTMSACGWGEDAPEEIVVTTPTPEPAKEAEPTPTQAPADIQNTTYTSKDKSISITLPDATWANKADEEDMVSFESPDQGKLLILHGEGDEDMSVAVIPTTPDTAVALEQAADLEQGTDFVIHDFASSDVGGIGVYSYTVEYLTEKSGYAYVVNKYFANDNEYYSVAGSVNSNDADTLAKVKESVESFAITGESTLKSAAPAKKAQSDASDGTSSDGTEGSSTDGTAVSDGSGQSTGDGTSSDGTYDESSSGSTSSGYSDDALTDTNQTRTIYSNDGSGAPRVIYADGNGGWVDDYGNTYRFETDEDVYDQDDVSYYYHGEAADVYYMPIEY